MKRDIYESAFLIKKSLIEDLSKEEQDTLNQLLEDEHFKDLYREFYDLPLLHKRLSEYEEYSHTDAYKVFLERVKIKPQRKNRTGLVRILSVAAVMLIIACSTYYLSNLSNNTKPAIATTDIEISSGSKKAQLILADGSTVNIGESDINVQQQSGVSVKYQNGLLSYETVEKPIRLTYNELIIPRGGETSVTLEDGTKVWLNAGSKLKYPVAFVGNNRNVFLEGEAYFEVKEDKKKEFIVNTSFGNVKVLGTAFGVNAYPDEDASYTTLVSGKVLFYADGTSGTELLPGEQIKVSANGEATKRHVDVEEYIGWKDGIYVFKNKTLKDIMKTFELWYDITADIENPSLASIKFTGHLKRYDNINIFLDALSRTGDVQYKVDGRKIILYK